MTVAEQHKICKLCQQTKPLDEFYWHSTHKRHSARCAECEKREKREKYPERREVIAQSHARWRAKNLDRIRKQQKEYYHKDRLAYQLRQRTYRFGIEPDDFLAKLRALSFRCEICGNEEGDNWDGFLLIDGKRPLAVDHDHNTGQFRGLLCRRCNKAIGCFGDSIELLERAVEYLKQRAPSTG